MIDTWQKYPAGEFIPLMKHMFDYSLRTVLFTLFGLGADDEQLIRTVHASYDVVSFTFCFFSLLCREIVASSSVI